MATSDGKHEREMCERCGLLARGGARTYAVGKEYWRVCQTCLRELTTTLYKAKPAKPLEGQPNLPL